MTVQATFAATVVDEFVRGGVTDAVVAPGSRSTPLALALAGDGRIRIHVVLDERSAGFLVLGLGLASGRPAVVLTTSGTAAVELHPAVVEAYYARVPLIACTADRPPELRDVGAPQTIDQRGLFAGAVRWECDPGPPDDAGRSSWRSLAARAVAESSNGPVHLNLSFREPLLGEPDELPPGRPDGGPWHRVVSSVAAPPTAAVDAIASGRRGVIIAGAGAGDPAVVHAMAATLGWPLLADPLSGCRLPVPHTIAAADAVLRVGRAPAPDVALHLGRRWASKAVAAIGAERHIVLDWIDPDRRADLIVPCDPTALCRAVVDAACAETDAGWLEWWADAERRAQSAFDDVLAGHPEVTEPGVARTLAALLPDPAALVVSSSMPVRDVEWYSAPRRGLRALANRGANGIDGVMSTALGVAAAVAPGPTAALLGDLAFLHDANALLVRDVDCVLVVVDNDGGGVFSFLPQRAALAEPRFEQLFGTPHGLDLAAVATAHGVAVTPIASIDELAPTVTSALAGGGVHVVHARTDRDANVAVHDELHAAVSRALEDVGSGADDGGQQGLELELGLGQLGFG